MRDKKLKQIGYIDKSANILLFIYTMLFILFHTIAGFYAAVWIERLECVVGAMLALVMIMKIASLENSAKIKWLKSSVLIVLYFAIRTASFVDTGFDYSVARTVFFEGVYLFVITGMILDSQFCKKKIMKFFVIVNFVINVINVCIYYVFCYIIYINWNQGIFNFLSKYTFYGDEKYIFSSLYDNPNAFGIMTALAMILALNLISKNDTFKRKIVIFVYMIFSLYCVNLSECRSAMLSLAIVAICWAIVVISKKKITGRMLVIAAFITALLVTGGLYGYMNKNQDTGLYAFNETETAIEQASSGRYSIWKAGYYTQQNSRLLGAGNTKLEIEERNDFIYHNMIDNGQNVDSYVETVLGTHNGYLAMIYCTGILGFLAFMAVLLQKILEAKSLRYGGWYLAVIFFMSVNMFETMTIVSKFFVCLLTFIILAMDNNDDEHGYELERSDEAKLL